jgi:predicted dehydrogenase
MAKVGVIGTGHLGRIHTMLWAKNENAELVGIYENSPERAKEIATEFDTKAFDNLDSLLDLCDAVTISVPTVYHFAIAEKCIAKGVHCLIEKPITATNEEANKLIELAEDANVLVQVGHVERFNPAIAALNDFNLDPLFIEAHRLAQFKPRAIDVSVIHDLMIHDIDIVLALTNSKVKSIDANGVAVITDTPDICNARLTFENGAVANLTASRISANPMRKMRIFQKDAYLSIDFGKPDVDIFKLIDQDKTSESQTPTMMLGSIEAGLKNKNIYFEKPTIPKINAIAEEQQSFLDSIQSGKPIAVPARDAAEALRIAEEINRQVTS